MNELYSLKWKNHQLNLVDVFEDLWEKEAFVDLTLSCAGGKNYSAHRMVLSACSLYFRELFLDPVLKASKHPVVFLRDVRGEELEALLRFMYRGHIDVVHDDLGPLLKLAHALQIKGLTSVSSEEQSLLNAGTDACKKRPFSDDLHWSPGTRTGSKKRKSDSPVSSTSKLCEKPVQEEDREQEARRDEDEEEDPEEEANKPGEEDGEENETEEDDEGEDDANSSQNPVIPGEGGGVNCDKDVQSSSGSATPETEKSPNDQGNVTNTAAGAKATPVVIDGEGDGEGEEESRDDSVEDFEYGDGHPENMNRWLKTEVVDMEYEDDEDLEDDIEDIDDDTQSGEGEDTLNAEGSLEITPQTDLVSSGGGDAAGDVMHSTTLSADSLRRALYVQCPECNQVMTQGSFARHRWKHDIEQGVKKPRFTCFPCRKFFYRKDHYLNHINSRFHRDA